MPVKITNIGGHEIHRYYEECPHCGGELQNIMMYGEVCIDCDKEPTNEPKTDKKD